MGWMLFLSTPKFAVSADTTGGGDDNPNRASLNKKPKTPNSSTYGAGLCAATPSLQLRNYGGCRYVCEFTYDDPFDIRIGTGHLTGREVTAACGPGRFCPALLVVEKEHPGAPEPVHILSCTN